MKPRHALLALALILSACAADRYAVIGRTAAGLDAGRRAFVEGDAGWQARIVARASSQDEGARELAAYRGRRDKVATAFVAAYSALALASVEPSAASLVELGSTAAAAVRGLRELFTSEATP